MTKNHVEVLRAILESEATRAALLAAFSDAAEDLFGRLRREARVGNAISAAHLEGQISALEGLLDNLDSRAKQD